MNNNPSEIKKQNQEIDQSKENQLTLTQDNIIDLSELDQEQIADLKKHYTEGMIDLKKKAEEMQIDENTLNSALDTFVRHTHNAIESGSSLTITHTQSTNTGKTEVVIGNTEKAAKGKISKSADKDKTVWIVSIIAIVAILIGISLGIWFLK